MVAVGEASGDPAVDLQSLASAFQGRLLTSRDDLAPFLVDWRGKWRGHAIAVAQPNTTQDVAAVVRWCRARRIPITPQGGNTGLAGGAAPQGGLVLSLARLNGIRRLDLDNDTLVAEAGCILQRVQEAAADADRLFPLSLAAEGSCTIGGVLSTNAGGTAVLRYGNARELCLGLEVVTASGEIWDGLRGLRKDNTGYDLKDLFIGAEGTLGIITAAVLKLYPRPSARAAALVAVADPTAALGLLRLAKRRLGPALTACELVSEACLALVSQAFPALRRPLDTEAPWYVLLECSDLLEASRAEGDLTALLEAAYEAGVAADATVAASDAQSSGLWAWRENISEAQARHGKNIKHDVSVPLSEIPAFITLAETALLAAAPEAMPIVFGHLGDGNLHFNLSARTAAGGEQLAAREPELNLLIHDMVHEFGGSVSAEHGLGLLRREEAARYKPPLEIELMRTIKTALDPEGLFNPGKVLT